MLALRQVSVAGEFVKWMVLLMIAAILAMLLATRMAAADSAPGLLPGNIDRVARPMPEMTRPFFPEVGPPLCNGEVNLIPAIKVFINGWKAADGN